MGRHALKTPRSALWLAEDDAFCSSCMSITMSGETEREKEKQRERERERERERGRQTEKKTERERENAKVRHPVDFAHIPIVLRPVTI